MVLTRCHGAPSARPLPALGRSEELVALPGRVPGRKGRDGRGETLAEPHFRRVCLWPDSAARAFETHLLSSLDRASRTHVWAAGRGAVSVAVSVQ